MSKAVILFDVDGTLIDSKSMANLFCEKISQQSGISFDEITRLRDEYIQSLNSTTDYHPDEMIGFINKTKNKKINSREIFFKTKKVYKKYIYE
ncbi:MAG: hypothetical protein KIH89_000855, partial [Candidatus Shapirobacteria bacterium]|nr:hypothetical protein [Candidatus Shapirobacteria bacterium]